MVLTQDSRTDEGNQVLFSIDEATTPKVLDRGTLYAPTSACPKCGVESRVVLRIGAYLPSWKRDFGLLRTINGVVASEKSIEFLFENGITQIEIGDAEVVFEKADRIVNRYRWLKPNQEIELVAAEGSGPAIACDECKRRTWRDKNLSLPKLPEVRLNAFFQIRFTWILLADERFVSLARRAPDGCHLRFERWYHQGSAPE